MQPSELEVNTHTWKNHRHFLLVDDKIGLKEDTENDPSYLQIEKKESNNCTFPPKCTGGGNDWKTKWTSLDLTTAVCIRKSQSFVNVMS